MSSPYKKYSMRMQSFDMKKNAEDLEIGRLYPVTDLKLRESNFIDKLTGKKPMNMIAYFQMDSLNCYVYLPSTYNDPDQEDFESMKRDIANKRPPNLSYYGNLGNTKRLYLHEYGEECDKTILQTVTEANENSKKRKLDFDSSQDNVK